MTGKHYNPIYALRNNEVVYIEDVERGLNCNCICPVCGKELIAKKGDEREHHFAHRNNSNCKYAYQTSLHLAAKEVLKQEKRIMLPPVILSFPGSCTSFKISDSIMLDIDNVELEKHFGSIIPDVVISKGNKKLFVEIYVTHKVEGDKIAKIRDAGISTIEVDLSKIDHAVSKAELANIFIKRDVKKKWVYNRKCEEYREKIFENADKRRIISRGLAYHVDWCPIQARKWHGKAYANVIDDCWYCKYNVRIDRNVEDEMEYIYCIGRKRIAEIEDLNRFLQTK